MPLYDLVCEQCGRLRLDAILSNRDVPVPCPENSDHGPMKRLPCAPSMITISGYSQFNGYSRGKMEVNTAYKDMKVTVEAK